MMLVHSRGEWLPLRKARPLAAVNTRRNIYPLWILGRILDVSAKSKLRSLCEQPEKER